MAVWKLPKASKVDSSGHPCRRARAEKAKRGKKSANQPKLHVSAYAVAWFEHMPWHERVPGYVQADEEEHFNSTLVMRRILKLAFLNAIQRRHIRQHQKNIEVDTTTLSVTGEGEKKRIAALTDLKSQIESTGAATEDNKLQASIYRNSSYLQEFDAYDEDRSGYIDVKELKGLLEKLGEELSEEELDQAQSPELTSRKCALADRPRARDHGRQRIFHGPGSPHALGLQRIIRQALWQAHNLKERDASFTAQGCDTFTEELAMGEKGLERNAEKTDDEETKPNGKGDANLENHMDTVGQPAGLPGQVESLEECERTVEPVEPSTVHPDAAESTVRFQDLLGSPSGKIAAALTCKELFALRLVSEATRKDTNQQIEVRLKQMWFEAARQSPKRESMRSATQSPSRSPKNPCGGDDVENGLDCRDGRLLSESSEASDGEDQCQQDTQDPDKQMEGSESPSCVSPSSKSDGSGVLHQKSVPHDVPIFLNIYDVTHYAGVQWLNALFANQYSPLKFGGIFHIGVQIGQKEWSYGFKAEGTGVFWTPPIFQAAHHFRETVRMGQTKLSKRGIANVIKELEAEWSGPSYNVFGRNCCHFADALCQRLEIGRIPEWTCRHSFHHNFWCMYSFSEICSNFLVFCFLGFAERFYFAYTT
eukprot:Skav217029  [mRNA]  locus=scaffold1803:367117:393577:- [translate_table: standard]